MPAFKSFPHLAHHLGTVQVRAMALRLPQAFDQWIEAKRELVTDNPGLAGLNLQAHDTPISLLVNEYGKPLGYLCQAANKWYITNAGRMPKRSSALLITEAITRALPVPPVPAWLLGVAEFLHSGYKFDEDVQTVAQE